MNADVSKLDDSVLPIKETVGTCLTVASAVTKDCIEGFHLQDVQNFNHHKLLQMKLAFSLEQIISITKQALEIERIGDSKESNCIFFSTVRSCIRCIQTVLTDTNMQVSINLCRNFISMLLPRKN